jgi:hypothetical protein
LKSITDPPTAGYSSLNTPYSPASGGADGSLLLSAEESGRQINDPMQNYRNFLLNKYKTYQNRNVGAADFVQAAGAIGIKSCPGGPTVKTVSNSRGEPRITHSSRFGF